MSAQFKPSVGPSAAALADVLIEPMTKEDLEAVIAVENTIYTFPWTLLNFRDSLDAGYSAWTLKRASAVGRLGLAGYCVLMFTADEAHLLNLSVGLANQTRGYGLCLLEHTVRVARAHAAQSILLEVRVSNSRAIGIYSRFGFTQVGTRKGYYPYSRVDGNAREDAIVMRLELW